MKRLLFAAAVLAVFSIAPAHAQTQVGDWTIEKRTQDTHCNASRGYKDADDENNQYGIVLKLKDGKIAVIREYMDTELTKAIFG